MAILATLPTLDESGVAVRQTGGRDPHRGIRISDAQAGGAQAAGVAPSASALAPSPSIAAPLLGQGQRGCRQFLRPRWHRGGGGLEEERRRRLRRADGSFISDPPEASEDC